MIFLLHDSFDLCVIFIRYLYFVWKAPFSKFSVVCHDFASSIGFRESFHTCPFLFEIVAYRWFVRRQFWSCLLFWHGVEYTLVSLHWLALLVQWVSCAGESACSFLATWWTGAESLCFDGAVGLVVPLLIVEFLNTVLHGEEMTTLSISQRKEVSECRWRVREELGSFHSPSPLHRVVCRCFWWDQVRNCSYLWLAWDV